MRGLELATMFAVGGGGGGAAMAHDPVADVRACLGSQFEARVEISRLSNPCYLDGSCADLPLSLYAAPVEVACLTDAIDDCAYQEQASSCFVDLSRTIETLRDDTLEPFPTERVSRAGDLPGLPPTFALLDQLERASSPGTPIDCPTRMTEIGELRGIDPGAICDAYTGALRLTEARSLARRVLAKEDEAE